MPERAESAVASGHSRTSRTAADLDIGWLTRCVKHTSKQPFTTPSCEQPSNQVNNYRQRQQWTPADAEGRSLRSQVSRISEPAQSRAAGIPAPGAIRDQLALAGRMLARALDVGMPAGCF